MACRFKKSARSYLVFDLGRDRIVSMSYGVYVKQNLSSKLDTLLQNHNPLSSDYVQSLFIHSVLKRSVTELISLLYLYWDFDTFMKCTSESTD